MFFDYIKEREEKDVVKSEFGFMTYRIFGEEMHIYDMYVIPDKRKNGECWNLFFELLEIAKAHKVKYMVGQVVPSMHGSTVSLQTILAAGFKLFKAIEDRIILIKEL